MLLAQLRSSELMDEQGPSAWTMSHVERLWRSIKYEEAVPEGIPKVGHLRPERGLGLDLAFYLPRASPMASPGAIGHFGVEVFHLQ